MLDTEGMSSTARAHDLVLVTGAGGGIGKAITAALLGAKFSVLGVDINEVVLQVPEEARGAYYGVVADTRDEDAMRQVVAEAPASVRHVVTCAGIALPEESQNDAGRGLPPPDVFRGSVELNLTGHYVAVAAAWPAMREGTGNRSVTFICSINALQGFGLVGYSAAKAGLIGLTRALLVPLGNAGVRVNVISPGTVSTPATRAEWAHVADHFEQQAASIPLGHLGEPGDIADAVLALVRDLRHVSGHNLVVDGGQSLAR